MNLYLAMKFHGNNSPIHLLAMCQVRDQSDIMNQKIYRDLQGFVDQAIDKNEEKRILVLIESNPLVRKKYDQLVLQKKWIQQWWEEKKRKI